MTDKERQEAPEFFVSRRGRQVGVHEVDLKGIDIEDNAPKAASKKNPVKSASKKPIVTKRSVSSKPKLIFVGIIVVLLGAPLLVAELVAAEYRTGVTGAKTDLGKLVTSEVLPMQKKSAISADELRTIATKVNDIASRMCRGGFMDNSAELYPRAKTALDECKTAQRNYAALTSSLYELESESRYLEKISSYMKPVTTPITDEYAVIGAQQTAWLEVSENIKKLAPPQRMKIAHADLSTHVNAVAEAWSKLNTANNQQDAVAFEESEKTLTTKYEAIRGTSQAFSEVIAESQATITADYNALK